MKLGEVLGSINTGKTPVITRENEREYVPYIVARSLSYFPDTVFYANEVNHRGCVDKKAHYDYLFNSVRKRKRFSPWQKREEDPAIPAIAWAYGINRRRAEEYLTILSKSDRDRIIKEYKTANP
jgi:hypothetical protein